LGKRCVYGHPNPLRGETKIFYGHPMPPFLSREFCRWPNHALSPLFLSRLSLGKVAELERPRRHPKAFGIPSNLLTGIPSSVPCPLLRRMSVERSAFDVCVQFS